MARIEDFEPLSAAEKTLLRGLSSGEVVVIGDGDLPSEEPDPTREIRGAFLREVILDAFEDLADYGDYRARVHEKGVQLSGSRISGWLDLEGCRIPRDIALVHCRFNAVLEALSASVDNLFLNGSTLPGLNADRLEAKGGVFLRGVTATGEVRLPGARLGGNFECDGGRFAGDGDGDALSANGLEAKGGVFLRGATVDGTLRLSGARLGGSLSCVGATLHGPDRGEALIADRLEAKGSVFLRNATAEGSVWLGGARLGDDLDCEGATLLGVGGAPALVADGLDAKGSVAFDGATVGGTVRLGGATLGGQFSCNEATFVGGGGRPALFADGLIVRGDVLLRERMTAEGAVRLPGAKVGGDLSLTGSRFSSGEGGDAITLNGADITGRLILRGGTQVQGGLDLAGAHVGLLVDTRVSWPDPGHLLLDRFSYDAISGGAPVDAAARIDWLDRQDAGRWGADFWPQPWEQCAKVLREMGHREDARKVLIAKEKRQRKAARERLRKNLLFEDAMWFAVWDRVLAVTVRYGHVPLLAFAWLFGFWALGALVFQGVAQNEAIKPNSSRMFRAAEWVDCAPGRDLNTGTSQLACFLDQPEAKSYPAFSPLIYSADTLLPIVDLEMQGYWIPDDQLEPWGAMGRYYLWFQIFMGWALSLLAVAGFSGLIRTDSK